MKTTTLPAWANPGARLAQTQALSHQAAASDGFEQALLEAAYSGLISHGLIQQGYHAKRTRLAEERRAAAEEQGNLADQLASFEAELEALIEQAPPAPPKPTILRTVAGILPFGKDRNHG
jgi:hypothetical protein